MLKEAEPHGCRSDLKHYCLPTKKLLFLQRNSIIDISKGLHCVKSVRIQSFSGPYFPALGLNTDTDTFHAVLLGISTIITAYVSIIPIALKAIKVKKK